MKARKSKLILLVILFEKYLLSNADLIITNGDDTLNYYKKLYPKQKKIMKRIYNAVDYNKFSLIPIFDLSEKERLRVSFLGRFVDAKGFDDFIQSVNGYSKTFKKDILNFSAYGHGSGVKNIDAKYINYMGPYNSGNLIEIFEKNDIFLFLNKSQNAGGLSHALLEVMSAGKIIIAWSNDVHCQILNDKNSILLEEGDIQSLINTFHAISENHLSIEFLQSLRINARNTAGNFTIEKHIEAYIGLVSRIS